MTKRPNYLLLVLFPFLFLVGCSSGDDAKVQAPAKKPALFDQQIQALEKAKAVEQTLQQEAARQRLEIEKQTQ